MFLVPCLQGVPSLVTGSNLLKTLFSLTQYNAHGSSGNCCNQPLRKLCKKNHGFIIPNFFPEEIKQFAASRNEVSEIFSLQFSEQRPAIKRDLHKNFPVCEFLIAAIKTSF